MFEHQCLHLGEQTVGAPPASEDAYDLGFLDLGAVVEAVNYREGYFAFVEVLAEAFLPSVLFSGIRD